MIDADATDFTALAMAAASARITSNIVQAYVSHNAISRTDIPAFIAEVYAAVSNMSTPVPPEPEPERKPAIDPKKSITHDVATCIECGARYKSLRRHLRAAHDLTPEAYNARWGRPADAPIVAPAYSAVRSQLAKDNGLGKKAPA
jgi:predicted transcriptional regulator